MLATHSSTRSDSGCPPLASQPALVFNAKFAATPCAAVPEKPRLTRVSGRLGRVHEKKIKSENEKKAEAARRYRRFLAMRQRMAIHEAGLGGKFKSLCACSAFPVPEHVRLKSGELKKTGAPGAVQVTWRENAEKEGGEAISHAWVKKCASPLTCFVCAPKIHWFRSQEVQKICRSLHQAGFSWLFWTFTAPHDLFSEPGRQVELFQKAMRIFKEHFDRFKDRWGLRFYIRAVEMTDDSPGRGRKSGCHFHHHYVVFFDREGFTGSEIAEMQAFLARRWVEALIKVGICPEEKRDSALRWAFRLDVPRKPSGDLEDSDLIAVSEYLAKGASLELTPGIGVKQDRKVAGRISHWRVMEMAFTYYPDLKPRALAIMKALKGRSWLQYSPGLKSFCGLEEITDQQIMKEKLDKVVAQYDNEQWRKVDEIKAQKCLQDAIIELARLKRIDLDHLPLDKTNKKELNYFSPVIKELQEITVSAIRMIIETGCDPVTGDWVWKEFEDLVIEEPG